MNTFNQWWEKVGPTLPVNNSFVESVAKLAYEYATEECIKTRSDWDIVALKAFVTRFVATQEEHNRLYDRAKDLLKEQKHEKEGNLE